MVAHFVALHNFNSILPALYAPAGRQSLLGRLRASYARAAHRYLLDPVRIGTYLLRSLEARGRRGLMQRKAPL